MTLKERFLRAKHWQLFLLMYGIPILFPFILFPLLFISTANGNEPEHEVIFSFMAIFPLIMLVVIGVQFGWFWSLGVGLQKILPEDLKLNTGRFKVFFFIPIIYMSIIFLIMGLLITHFMDFAGTNADPNISLITTSIFIILLIHFFSMFCIFYCNYFVAKTLKTIELQRETSFGEFIGEFFLIWFFPIGIWILQPKVNLIMNTASENNSDL